jgi:predicted PurR-regulated permease PerM
MPIDDSNRVTPPQAHEDAEGQNVTSRIEIHIPLATFIKIFVAILLAGALYVLWPLLLLVFLALLLAVTLNSSVDWLTSHKINRRLSLSLVIFGVVATVALSFALILPVLVEQVDDLSHSLPKLRDATVRLLPAGGTFREAFESMLDSSSGTGAPSWYDQFITAGGTALGGITQTMLLLVIAIYLLVDGGKLYAWILAFFSPLQRRKLRATSQEISNIIFGYVAGQFITSILVTVYSFAVLSLLHVPGALTLAVLAGILDVLPVLGFIISTVPAFLLAMGVSPQTGITVLALYILFHLFEAYFIIPKVYGKRLRLSTLTVLLGLSAGALLAGIPGVLAALPLIASYEAIEKIWLARFLREGVAEKHEMQKDEEFGEKS